MTVFLEIHFCLVCGEYYQDFVILSLKTLPLPRGGFEEIQDIFISLGHAQVQDTKINSIVVSVFELGSAFKKLLTITWF